MTNHGFITVAAAIPSVRVADVAYNIEEIERLVEKAEQSGVELLVFPVYTNVMRTLLYCHLCRTISVLLE